MSFWKRAKVYNMHEKKANPPSSQLYNTNHRFDWKKQPLSCLCVQLGLCWVDKNTLWLKWDQNIESSIQSYAADRSGWLALQRLGLYLDPVPWHIPAQTNVTKTALSCSTGLTKIYNQSIFCWQCPTFADYICNFRTLALPARSC